MKDKTSETQSLVTFRNSQGVEARGTLMNLTRNQAVFEVYNPYSLVQLSEVLSDFKIMRRGRTVYSGRAVASNLVATGLMLIVSATLVDPWSDLTGLQPGEGLREEVESFISDWETDYQLRDGYQLAVTNISAFLSELNRWLQEFVLMSGVGEEDEEAAQRAREVAAELMDPLVPKMKNLFGHFEEAAEQIPPEETVPHKAFAQRELHPLLLCSPFIYRTFTKPLGYAGDYEMVNMILRDPLQGPNTYARIMNVFTLQRAPAEAHRNRIEMLFEILRTEAEKAAAENRQLNILNVGCGPAAEVERFVRSDSLSERCSIELLDFNRETLDYARDVLHKAARESDSKPDLNYVHRSIHHLLKQSARRDATPEPQYDLVYCAGLFDYLSDRICERLVELFYAWTNPGGLLVTTNVHTNNPIRYYMEYLLEWHLNYRDEVDLLEMAPQGSTPRVYTDSTGVNVFLEIKKSD
ncbi:MAG: class I SAM-dependent methyltransferase [Planctomycetota bacterium]